MCCIVVSIVGVSLLAGSVFTALETASTEPSRVSRRKEKDIRTDWGEVSCLAMLSQH